MDLHERQQFDFLLHTAVERYVERLEQRNGGAAQALRKLQADPQADGIWLDRFTAAIFADFLLDNVGGACFVLAALAKRNAPPAEAGAGAATIEQALIAMAKVAFAALLAAKTEEALAQAADYQPVDTGARP